MSALDRLRLLGDRADPLTRWQAEAELKEQGQRRSKEAMAESEYVQALRHEIADLRHELANVEARLTECDKDFTGIADTVVTALDKMPGWVEKTIEARVTRSEAEMCGKIAEKFGELLGRLKALDPTVARAKGEFKFANECEPDGDAITELPNPLPPRRAAN
jgi:hypothetical protein